MRWHWPETRGFSRECSGNGFGHGPWTWTWDRDGEMLMELVLDANLASGHISRHANMTAAMSSGSPLCSAVEFHVEKRS